MKSSLSDLNGGLEFDTPDDQKGDWVLKYILITIEIISSLFFSSCRKPDSSSTPMSDIPRPETTSSNGLVLITESEIIVEENTAANSIENGDRKSSIEKVFIIRPTKNGHLALRFSYESTDGRVAYAMYTYILHDSKKEVVMLGQGIVDNKLEENVFEAKATEIYRLKVNLMSKNMRLSVVAKEASPKMAAKPVSTEPVPNLEVPAKIECAAKMSGLHSKGMGTPVSILTNQQPSPTIEVKSTEKELNFKIGGDRVGGRKIEADLTYDCEDDVKHSDFSYNFEQTCRLFVSNGNGGKIEASSVSSRFYISNKSIGQICKYLSPQHSLCWELSECK